MGHEWYKDWFADERYLALYRHRNTQEASLALDLIEKATGIAKDVAILDLACGAGRHSINLAKRGYINITGIDLSSTLIREAIHTAEAEGLKINFKEQDMRFFEGRYDLIMNLFTSFGYFAVDRENEEVILRVGKCLNPNGFFVIDFFNAALLCEGVLAHDEKVLPSGEHVEQFREIRHGRVEKKIIIRSESGSKEFHESVRLFQLSDFEKMFAKAELQIVHQFGDYSGTPFDEGSSPRLFLVAKKDGKT
ncbi:MAG: class I SAM-dependent methyltransferase [Candidatus Kapaibacterium sp.]